MEKNYNEIDDFFKKAFEQENASDEGWNAPSDEVWEKLSEIEGERKPVFLYWKWAAVAASLLLFFLVGQFIYQQNQLQEQAEKIEQLEKQIQNQEVEQSENGLAGKETQKLEINKINSNSSESAIATEAVKSESRISQPPQNTSTSFTDINTKSIAQKAIVTKDSSEVKMLLIPDLLPVLREKVDAIASLTSDIDLLNTPIPDLNMPKIIPEKTKTSYLTANYALTESAQAFDHRRIQNFRRSNVIKEENLNLGLRYTHFLDNKWFVEGGVHYSKSSAERRHSLRSRFQKNDERPVGNDNFESTHNLSLFSSAYDLETDVVLSRSSSSNTILDGRNLRLVGVVTNEIQRLSIPILVGHRLEYRKWNWTVKTGIAPTITLLDQVRLDRILSSEAEFEVKSVARTQRNPNTQQLSWYFYAGSSLSYRLNKAWAIQLEPYFSRSLSAQRGIRNNTIFNHSAGLHLGVQYTL